MSEVREQIVNVLADLKQFLRPEDHQNAIDMLHGGEYELAFDVICTQIHEYDIRIPRTAYEQLVKIGLHMNLPPRTWEILLTQLT